MRVRDRVCVTVCVSGSVCVRVCKQAGGRSENISGFTTANREKSGKKRRREGREERCANYTVYDYTRVEHFHSRNVAGRFREDGTFRRFSTTGTTPLSGLFF